MRIRFDQERYSVRESDGSVLVCIEVLGAMFQIETLLNVSTVDECFNLKHSSTVDTLRRLTLSQVCMCMLLTS